METAGATHRVGPDVRDLGDVALAAGPFVTVVLDTHAGVEDAARRLDVRWRTARDELAAQGAPEDAVDAVAEAVADAHMEGSGLAVVANADGVLHVAHHPHPPRRELVRWASVPSLVPVLAWRQALPAHVIVVADRVGADIVAVRPGLPDLAAQGGGDEFPVRKPAGGGWSQRRYQERAEVTWDQNAHDVADRVSRLADRVDARVIVLSGDVRATALVRDALPDRLRDLVRDATGGRSPDGSEAELGQQVAEHVAEAVEADTRALLAGFRQEAGQRDRAAVGPAATIAALARAQVDVLLVSDDLDDDQVAWFGPEPTQVSMWAPEVGDMGVDEPWRGRLVDVAVRSALGTGAGVRVVEAGQVEGGLSAVLRWGG